MTAEINFSPRHGISNLRMPQRIGSKLPSSMRAATTSVIFFPKISMARLLTYGLFENTSLSFEYLHGEFENDDERDLDYHTAGC